MDSLPHLIGDRWGETPPGAACANCGAVLQGRFCHVCGQNFDAHKRSILRLIWEGTEGLFDLDGRLLRTVPDLFFRPGRLARDYLEGRIARHVPPIRTFLVALLIFILAAEHAAHESTVANQRAQQARAAALATPRGRAAEAVRIRVGAATDRAADLKEAAADRAHDLADPDEKPARVEARYARELAKIQHRYATQCDKADRVAAGLPEPPAAAPTAASANKTARRSAWWKAPLRKATADPDAYLAVMFTWGQRAAILLLPIVGLSLALVYRRRRQYFIYDHMLVALSFLSFVFLVSAIGFLLPGRLMIYALGLAAVWIPINLFQTLRGAYASSLLGSALKTLFVWTTMVLACSVLLAVVAIFSLAQMG
jgi:hypothetical protein